MDYETTTHSGLATLPITHKPCPRCGKAQHRRRFVTKKGVIDKVCVNCRSLFVRAMPLPELKSRVAKGALSEERYAKLHAAKEEQNKRRRKEAMERVRAARAACTWERPERSARIALKLLQAYPHESPELMAWVGRFEALVLRAQKAIADSKTRRFLPTDRVLFWYDVENGMRHEARQLVEEFPGGADNSPIQVM